MDLNLKPHAFKTLQELKYFDEIVAMLKKETAENVASWIREVKGDRNEVKKASLIRQLYRLQKYIPAGQLEKMDKPVWKQRRLDEYASDIDELVMLTKLWYIQMERIDIGRAVEGKTKFLSKTMYREIEQAKDILVKIGELKVRLGHYEGAATERISIKGSTEHMHRIEGFSEAQRERLGSAMDKLLRGVVEGVEIEEAEYEIEETAQLPSPTQGAASP